MANEKSLADDFNERVTKHFRPHFARRVIPSHILPYLSCLGPVDEERIIARENQEGPTLAANLLFQLLIRRRNWFQDLVQALRQPDIGLNDLADEFESFTLTVPVRYEIQSFEDSFGKVNCDGKTSTFNQVKKIDQELLNLLSSGQLNADDIIKRHTLREINDTVERSKQYDLEKERNAVPSTLGDTKEKLNVSSPFKEENQNYTSTVVEPEKEVFDITAKEQYHAQHINKDKFSTETKVDENNHTEQTEKEIKGKSVAEVIICTEEIGKHKTELNTNESSLEITTQNVNEKRKDKHQTISRQVETASVSKYVDSEDDNKPIRKTTGADEENSNKSNKNAKNNKNEDKKKQLDLIEKELSLKRERIRLNLMEKVSSFVATKEDIPTMLQYFKQINMSIVGIDRGSVLINVQVHTLSGLQRLLQLWRLGGLKQLLDKDILTAEKQMILQQISTDEHEYPVRNITSHVTINDADIERCRTWLTHKNIEQVHLLDGLAFDRLHVAKFVRDRLPECLRRMAEDPILMTQLHKFYKHDDLLRKIELEANGARLTAAESVALLFLNWSENVLSELIRSLDRDTMAAVVNVSCILFLLLKCKNTKTIRIPTQNQQLKDLIYCVPQFQNVATVSDDGTAIIFKTEQSLARYAETHSTKTQVNLLSYMEVGNEIVIELEKLDQACQLLQTSGILRSELNGFAFSSDLLRDTVICGILPLSYFKHAADLERCPFLLQMLAFFDGKGTKARRIQSKSLKSKQDFRVVQIVMYQRYISGAWDASAFHVSDIFCKKTMGIGCDNHMEDEAKQMARLEAITKVSKDVYVDLSKVRYGAFDDGSLDENRKLVHALQWLNFMTSIHSFSQHKNLFYWKPLDPRFVYTNADCKFKRLGTAIFADEEASNQDPNFEPQQRPWKRIKLDSGSDSERVSISMDITDELGDIADETINDVGIISLDLSGQILTEAHVGHLSHYIAVSHTLRRLYLANCNLDIPGITDAFKTGSFENISRLNISDNANIGTLTEQFGLSYLSSLERLEIRSCNLGDKGIAFLASELVYLEKLKELDVSDNSMTSEGLLELITALITKTGLTSLHLQSNAIGDQGGIYLGILLTRLNLLEELNISETGIRDAGMEHISKSLVSKAMCRLLLNNNELSVTGAQAFFKSYSRPPLLAQLDFSGNALYGNLTEEYIPHSEVATGPSEEKDAVADFFKISYPLNRVYLCRCGLGFSRIFQDVQHYQSLSELTHLGLQENVLDDDFIEELSKCIQLYCNLLVHINLRTNHIGDRGAESLSSSLNGKDFLKEVLLDCNEISENGANMLFKCCRELPSFQSLDLSGNPITATAMKQLIEEMTDDKDSVEEPLAPSDTLVLRKENGKTFVDTKENK